METAYESRGYLSDSFRIFHLHDDRGTQTEYHYHEFCKLLLLGTGSGSYTVEGRRYQLKAGDIVLIDRHAIHRPEFQKGVHYERIIIYISPDFLAKYSLPDCDLEAVFSGSGGHVLRLKEKRRCEIFAQAQQISQELSQQDYGAQVIASAKLVALLVELLRERQSAKAVRPKPISPRNPRIRDMLRYIDAHLTEDIGIDRLAEEFYISKYHMMRLFREEVGQTIHDYVSERRLLHARELIRSGKSATESCFRSGFRSYSSFTRAYNKRFGSTPTGRGSSEERLYE